MSASACTSAPKQSAHHRWLLRPRYSLRLLLIGLTAFAIGFPIWYRWPYQETELIYRHVGGVPNRTLPPVGRVVKSWQRQWGGGRLQHGPTTVYGHYGEVSIEYYDRGQRTGRSLAYLDGNLQSAGFNERGKRHGAWTWYDDSGKQRAKSHWNHGRLEGECSVQLQDGTWARYRFANGSLTHFNGVPVADHLALLADAGINASAVAEVGLGDPVNWWGAAGSLRSLTHMAELVYRQPIIVDTKANDASTELDESLYFGFDLPSALVLSANVRGLVCNVHSGIVWIEPPRASGDWVDPTGVAQIQPPAGSRLAAVWDAPTATPDGRATLATALAAIGAEHNIVIDAGLVAPMPEPTQDFRVTGWGHSYPLRKSLTALLTQSRCRCELRGETLVIFPPEE